MVMYCCVPHCKSDSRKIKVSFHEFPVNMDLTNAWLKAIARKDFRPNDKSASSRVCGFHFKDSDFLPYRKRRCLKKDSVPSIFEGYPSYLTFRKSDKEFLKHKLKDRDYVPNEQVKQKKTSKTKDSDHTPNEQVKVTSLSIDQTESSSLIMLAESCYDATNAIQLVPEIEKSNTKETQTKIDSSNLSSKFTEIKRLRSLLVQRNKKIESLQKNLEENAKLAEYVKSNVIAQNVEKMQALCNEGYASSQVEFTLTQISNFGKQNPRWPDSVMRECVLLHASSPKSYEAIQNSQLFLLPSTRTLYRFLDTSLHCQSPIKGSVFPNGSPTLDLPPTCQAIHPSQEPLSVISISGKV